MTGYETDQAPGWLVFHIHEEVTHVRFANTQGGLRYAPWEAVHPRSTLYRRPWVFRGEGEDARGEFFSRVAKSVFAEAKFDNGVTIETHQWEGPRKKGFAQFRPEIVAEHRTSQFIITHDFQDRTHQWASYYDDRGNVFYPMYHHPDGYAWNSEFERGPDRGEDPVTCLVAHNYFRWQNPRLNDFSLRGAGFRCEAAFEGDLRGATAHLFALMSDRGNGEELASSGRYHMNDPDKRITLPGDGSFATTEFQIPATEGWVDYYRRRGELRDGTPPNLSFVNGFGIAFHDFEKDRLPAGVFKLRKWQFVF